VFIFIEVAPTDKTSFPEADEYEYAQDPEPLVYPIVSSQSSSLGRSRGFHSYIDTNAKMNKRGIAYSHSALWIYHNAGRYWGDGNVFDLTGNDPRTISKESYGLSGSHYFSYGELIHWEDIQEGVDDYKLWIEMLDDSSYDLGVDKWPLYDISATIKPKRNDD